MSIDTAIIAAIIISLILNFVVIKRVRKAIIDQATPAKEQSRPSPATPSHDQSQADKNLLIFIYGRMRACGDKQDESHMIGLKRMIGKLKE